MSDHDVALGVIAPWCGFLGAWLLVADPLYQGVHELLEQDRRAASGGATSFPAPPPAPSTWLWLMPPLMVFLRRRRSLEYRRTVLSQLPHDERALRADFLRKAGGWFVVAVGGSLIAVQETVDLVEARKWSTFTPVILIVGAIATIAVAIGYTVRRRPRL